jgi:hypothetical protein
MYAWVPLGDFSHTGFYGGDDANAFVQGIKSTTKGNYSLFLDGEFILDLQTVCTLQMAQVCDSERLQDPETCLLCTGSHQDQLQNTGCTQPLIVEFCNDNELWGGKPRHDGRNGTMHDLALSSGQIVNIYGNETTPIVWGGGFTVPEAAEAHLMGIQLGKNNLVLEGGKMHLDHVEFRGLYDCPQVYVQESNQRVSSCSCMSGNIQIDRNPPTTNIWAIKRWLPCNQVWLLQVQGEAFLNACNFRDLAFDATSENIAIKVMNGGFVKVSDSIFSNINGGGAIRVQDDGCFDSRNCDVRRFHQRSLDPATTLAVSDSHFSWIDSTFVNVTGFHHFDRGYSAIWLDAGTAGSISGSEFRSNNASGCVSGGAGTVFLNVNSSAKIINSNFVNNNVFACVTTKGGAGAIAIMNRTDGKYNATVLVNANEFSNNAVVTGDVHDAFWPTIGTYTDAAISWPNHLLEDLTRGPLLYTNVEATEAQPISGYH